MTLWSIKYICLLSWRTSIVSLSVIVTAEALNLGACHHLPILIPIIDMLQQKEKGKGASPMTITHSTNPSSVASSPAARSYERYEMVRDGLSQGFGAIKDVSEATEMLAPLKATCALMERALEMTRVCRPFPQTWAPSKTHLFAENK